MARRTQQEQVYAAQNVLPVGRTFDSIEDVQSYLDGLRELYWWPEGIFRVEAVILDQKWGGLARWEEDAGAGVVGFRSDCLNHRTVLHELAHVIADSNGSTGHDPIYCRTYLQVVYHEMGSSAYITLRDSFEQHGVVHDPEVPAR